MCGKSHELETWRGFFSDQYCLTEKLHRLASRKEGPEGARATHAPAQQPPCLVSAECYVTREVCSHPHLRPTDHGLEEKITEKKLSYTRLSFPRYSGLEEKKKKKKRILNMLGLCYIKKISY